MRISHQDIGTDMNLYQASTEMVAKTASICFGFIHNKYRDKINITKENDFPHGAVPVSTGDRLAKEASRGVCAR